MARLVLLLVLVTRLFRATRPEMLLDFDSAVPDFLPWGAAGIGDTRLGETHQLLTSLVEEVHREVHSRNGREDSVETFSTDNSTSIKHTDNLNNSEIYNTSTNDKTHSYLWNNLNDLKEEKLRSRAKTEVYRRLLQGAMQHHQQAHRHLLQAVRTRGVKESVLKQWFAYVTRPDSINLILRRLEEINKEQFRSKPRYKSQATDHKSQATDHKSRATDHKSQATDHKSQATDHKSQATDHKSQATDHKSQATDHKSQATDHKSQATDHENQATDHDPPLRIAKTELRQLARRELSIRPLNMTPSPAVISNHEATRRVRTSGSDPLTLLAAALMRGFLSPPTPPPGNTSSPRYRRSQSGIMYLPLGGTTQVQCPTAADAAGISITQMAFLSVCLTVFNIVVNISNNINNNNNNNNLNSDNNLSNNNAQLSLNVNSGAQINVMLPPPVPGRRKRSSSLRNTWRRTLPKNPTVDSLDHILHQLTEEKRKKEQEVLKMEEEQDTVSKNRRKIKEKISIRGLENNVNATVSKDPRALALSPTVFLPAVELLRVMTGWVQEFPLVSPSCQGFRLCGSFALHHRLQPTDVWLNALASFVLHQRVAKDSLSLLQFITSAARGQEGCQDLFPSCRHSHT